MKDSLSLFLEKISLFENHDPRLLIKNKVHLDPKIKSTILAINQSGWCWTLFCCQGHIRGKQKGCIPYVVFIVKNEYKSLLLEKIFNNIPFDVNIDFPLMNNFRVEISPGFKDEKYSLLDKENQWLLCAEDQIVWIIGKRADNRFIANETTKNPIKIEIN